MSLPKSSAVQNSGVRGRFGTAFLDINDVNLGQGASNLLSPLDDGLRENANENIGKNTSAKLNLTVLAGPTAVGKGTVSRKLLEKYPNIYLSVSATTRAPREGEEDGVHYHFITRDEFENHINAGDFLEWAIVHGLNMYGTLKQPIIEANNANRPALLEIDLQGARQVKELLPDAKFIFLAPPSFDILIARLGMRGTESDEEIKKRLATAREELAAQNEFDYVVVNDDLSTAVNEVAKIMAL